MKSFLTLSLFALGTASFAFAGTTNFSTPEIDGSTIGSALALVSGGVLILRSRRTK